MRNILFVLFLLLPSVCFGQNFIQTINESFYPSLDTDFIIPSDPNQAILHWRTVPRSSSNVVFAEIIPFFSKSSVSSTVYVSNYGYTTIRGDVGTPDSYSDYYTVIDSTYIYPRSVEINAARFANLYSYLQSIGLGTVGERRALINSFSGSPVQIINPSDIYAGFLNLFGPYANIFIGVFLTLFVVDLMTRKTKATVAESAKVARAAERREINQQIKNDTTAQVYKYRLSNLAGIKSGRIQDSEISQSQARRMFRETAEEYAEYRRSRGWVY